MRIRPFRKKTPDLDPDSTKTPRSATLAVGRGGAHHRREPPQLHHQPIQVTVTSYQLSIMLCLICTF